jgi:hypothetical protein
MPLWPIDTFTIPIGNRRLNAIDRNIAVTSLIETCDLILR